ncbi:MAG: PAC2 family protein [Dehalococcoidia bacterium]|nr:PAC2 family protein [Dehalococcoidia bacterium]
MPEPSLPESLRLTSEPTLRRPILIAGFQGWNDAGEAASSAVRFVHRRWRCEPLGDIDPEEFYDFTQIRPEVRLERGERSVEWPPNRFSSKQTSGQERDVILLSGIEPHIGWRSYIECIMAVCEKFEVEGAIILGALLAEVSHARPVRVTGSASAEWLARPLGITTRTRSTYEGPTGIVGVMTQALRDRGIATASLWANMPFYVQRTPNPKGSLALLERLNRGFGFGLNLHDLEVFAARFEAQVAGDLEENAEVAEYARRVALMTDEDDDDEPSDEPQTPDELPDAASMVEDLEQFLREQRGEQGQQ